MAVMEMDTGMGGVSGPIARDAPSTAAGTTGGIQPTIGVGIMDTSRVIEATGKGIEGGTGHIETAALSKAPILFTCGVHWLPHYWKAAWIKRLSSPNT